MSSLRAFGGGELWGDKLVRIVYLDESGTSSRAQEPILVVAGVIVHGDHQLSKVQIALRKIMENHIPEADRDKVILHATDIYSGEKYFDKARKPYWSWDRRAALLNEISAIPANLNLHITWAPIDKNNFGFARLRSAEAKESDLQLAVGAAYMCCMLEVDLWFRENAKQENCFVICEDNRETKQFIRTMHKRYQDRKVLTDVTMTEKDRNYFPLRHIQEDPSFQEKRVAHPLILADFIAFFVKRRLMADDRSFQFSEPWIHRTAGLKVPALQHGAPS